MIRLKPSADSEIKKLIFRKSVRADYFGVCECYTNSYSQRFARDIQTLITKLAIVVTRVSVTPIRINFCAQAIHYLCNDVLENSSLEQTFEKLGINKEGNKGKHTIDTVNIDMDRCVVAYNNMVNSIANKYNLSSLKEMIVKKNATPTTSTGGANPKKGHPSETATTVDERVRLKAELERGDGRYEIKVGCITLKKMVNFLLNVTIVNPDNLKISKVTATFKCGNNTQKKNLKKDNQSANSIDLPTSKFHGNIEASVVLRYRYGFLNLRSKKITATVSKNF